MSPLREDLETRQMYTLVCFPGFRAESLGFMIRREMLFGGTDVQVKGYFLESFATFACNISIWSGFVAGGYLALDPPPSLKL